MINIKMSWFFLFIIVLFLAFNCSWFNKYSESEFGANGKNTATTISSWDESTEPKITDFNSSSYTISWTKISNADHYELLKISSWNPISGSVVNTTTGNSFIINPDTGESYYVYARNYGNSEIDKVAIGRSTCTWGANAAFLTGTFTDDFDDGIINSNYIILRPHDVNESGGYLQLSINTTDLFPALTIPYDCLNKRFISLKFNDYEHRINDNWGGEIFFFNSTNNLKEFVINFSAHGSANGLYGTILTHNGCFFDANYNRQTDVTKQYSSTERFDQWFTGQIIVDRTNKTVRVYINGSQVGNDDSIGEWWTIDSKIFIAISPAGWNTGHYMRIDDLEIKSADTLTELGF